MGLINMWLVLTQPELQLPQLTTKHNRKPNPSSLSDF
jgi:hypothetical protein